MIYEEFCTCAVACLLLSQWTTGFGCFLAVYGWIKNLVQVQID